MNLLKIYRFALILFVLAVFAQVFRIRLLFVLDYILLGVLMFSLIWAKLSLRWVEIERQGNGDRASVGDYYEEVMTLKNRGFLPKLWLEVRDLSELPGHRLNFVQSLRPFGQVRWRAKTFCT